MINGENPKNPNVIYSYWFGANKNVENCDKDCTTSL